MATYQTAMAKLLHHPIDLNPDDIHAIKSRDPKLAKMAVDTWQMAVRWKEYLQKYPEQPKRRLPVVKAHR